MKDWITGVIETVFLGLGIALSWVKLSQKIEDDLQDLNKWQHRPGSGYLRLQSRPFLVDTDHHAVEELNA